MKKNIQRLKQPVSTELRDSCLNILRSKFYIGDDQSFYKDRQDLLRDVVLWPASWLNSRGVTIHGEEYRQLFVKIFIEAAAHVQSKVRYRPAYLRHVIQEHFRHHGEDLYDSAKATRNLVEGTMLLIGKTTSIQADPVRELAAARDILTGRKPKKCASKQPVKSQLTLFG